jgi:acyl-CoA dehydrogenase
MPYAGARLQGIDRDQMHGATGISQWTPLAEMYQDVRHLRFADGPDEVHWIVVGRHELSMP